MEMKDKEIWIHLLAQYQKNKTKKNKEKPESKDKQKSLKQLQMI